MSEQSPPASPSAEAPQMPGASFSWRPSLRGRARVPPSQSDSPATHCSCQRPGCSQEPPFLAGSSGSKCHPQTQRGAPQARTADEALEDVAWKEGRFHTWRRRQAPQREVPEGERRPLPVRGRQLEVQPGVSRTGTPVPSEAAVSSNSHPVSLPQPWRQQLSDSELLTSSPFSHISPGADTCPKPD